MTGARIAAPLTVAVALAIGALTLAPRAFEAGFLLSSRDDPVALADHAVARSFDATVAAHEIEGALAANDPDLANSFLDLARDRNVPVDAALAAKVDTANAGAASAARSVESFARGLITGEPDDLSGLAGTALGDLFVFGDIRDAVREGTRFAAGQQADELILGLACVGLAITAGTYASLGAAAPARVGMTVVKAARKTGRIGGQMGAWISRSVREVVDWTSLRSAIKGASMTQPAAAVRAAREAVKVEKARDLVRLVGDVGRVQSRAGTQAALDGMKLAQGPRDMSKIARLAATKGGKTRAILKLAGRSAIVLTVGAFNLANWMLWAFVTAFGLVSALKRMTERATERSCARRRLRRARQQRAREQVERRAILKLAGRSAIVLTVGAFNLANWMLWAIVTAFGLVSALKRMTERATERSCARRRLRRARQQRAREQVERRAREQGPLAPRTDEPTVIAFPAPALVPALVPVSTPKRGSTQVEPSASAAIPFPRVASGGARMP